VKPRAYQLNQFGKTRIVCPRCFKKRQGKVDAVPLIVLRGRQKCAKCKKEV
jgi:hypothetical protein